MKQLRCKNCAKEYEYNDDIGYNYHCGPVCYGYHTAIKNHKPELFCNHCDTLLKEVRFELICPKCDWGYYVNKKKAYEAEIDRVLTPSARYYMTQDQIDAIMNI